MPNFNYFLNIPAANNNPSVDQPNMETNTNSINSIIGVDHFSFGSQNAADGTHQQVQLREVSGNNGTLPVGLLGNGWDTLYSSLDTVNASGELWFVRGANPNGIRLTGPGRPVAASNGRSFLAGGVRYQWGILTFSGAAPHATADQLFNVPFTTTCFNVSLTPIPSSSAQTDNNTLISAQLNDNTKFTWIWNGVDIARYPRAFWTAIGD